MIISCINIFTPEIAQRIIDRAVASGIRRENLRWCVSVEQRRLINRTLQNISAPDILRYEYEHGQSDTGLFAGIPYVTDSALKDSEIRLDIVQCVGNFAVVEDLPVSNGLLTA